VAIFDTIRHWRSRGLSRREIARRLHVDVKTVRRNLAKIKNGATAPTRTSPGSKLNPYRERIKQRVEQGCTAWSIGRRAVGRSVGDGLQGLGRRGPS
jgi:transposase